MTLTARSGFRSQVASNVHFSPTLLGHGLNLFSQPDVSSSVMYCFQWLSSGLSVSQDIIQLKMDQIFDGMVGIVDDVAVYTKDDKGHGEVLHNLLRVDEGSEHMFNRNNLESKRI